MIKFQEVLNYNLGNKRKHMSIYLIFPYDKYF